MEVAGSCLCGDVTCEAEIDPARVALCHRADCQVNSGAALGGVVAVGGAGFRLRAGRLTEFEKTAGSGRERQLSFCGRCGTRIHARTRGDPGAFFGLGVGTIRQRATLRPRVQA